MAKIVRAICYFTKKPGEQTLQRLDALEKMLESEGYRVQTKRICSPDKGFQELKEAVERDSVLLSTGSKEQLSEEARQDFFEAEDVAFNLDLTDQEIGERHVDLLFEAMEESPSSTFSFCYSFNNPGSSPFHPPAQYEEEGFSVGLQATNLSEGCDSLEEWFEAMEDAWNEIDELFDDEDDFLGIESSITPFERDEGSLIDFITGLGTTFDRLITQNHYLRTTEFIKSENPNPTGLCGLMLPCLEDFPLAEEYDQGNFPIERNLFLSLHSGLGVDTYPIGVDEDKERVLDILKTIKTLSDKYQKPLSARFVSDGEAKIGDETDFQNKWLKDVEVRRL